MKNFYLDFFEEDNNYLRMLQEETTKYQKLYEIRIYDGSWPETLKDIINVLHKDMYNTILKMQENLNNAKEIRRLRDEAYRRQLREYQENDVSEGGESENSIGDFSSAQ